MNHSEILEKINTIDEFFTHIGLKKIQDLPENWNLDSSWVYVPIKDNYLVRYNNDERILLSINVFIMGGIEFKFSGKINYSSFESIQTDYDLNVKYQNYGLLINELRDWKLQKILR